MRRKSVGAALLLGAFISTASAMVLTTPVQIVRFQIYTDYANGDVVFDVNATFPGCDGFWLSPVDGGYKQAYAALMMAKASAGTVVVYAYDNNLWPGSSAYKYCKVRNLTLE